ncbi:MAG: MerR family transcriptional regulator [Pseudomonadota bacterium]
MENLTIGAVTRLTGIPAHTLRKWESRHNIAVPFRTGTGRRAYSAEHVEQLKLIKVLVGRRHALSQLAGLSLGELREMADLHDQSEPKNQSIAVSAMALIGPSISRLLQASTAVVHRDPADLLNWQGLRGADCDTLIVESDTLPAEVVDRLSSLSEQIAQVIVVYRYGRKDAMRQLLKQDIVLLSAPATDDILLSTIQVESETAKRPSSSAKFSNAELARIAALSPSIECECPKHIAQLLMDITSFERYSLECEDADPLQQALHQHLGEISAQARTLFEDALIAVATSDGLTIETNP